MSANEFMLRSKQYLLSDYNRQNITYGRQRGALRSIIEYDNKLTFSDQELHEIEILEQRKRSKSPSVQRLKLSGAETVLLKRIEAQRAEGTKGYSNYANPNFAQKGSDLYLGTTKEQLERAISNLSNQIRGIERSEALQSLVTNAPVFDTTKIKVHGKLSPEALVTLRAKGLI